MKHVNLIPTSLTDLSRTEKLEIYMKRKGITYGDISSAIGVSRTAARRLLLSNTVPSYRFSQLVRAGIPAEVIPPAKDIAPGPKSKISQDDTEPNSLEQAA